MLGERERYAQNSSVVGVIGTFNSGCAEIIVPVLNRASNGPIAMVSPANTYVGLTHGGPGTVAGEPGKYYPTGKRNYARVVAADDYQGAADAMLAKSLGDQEGVHPERQGGLRPRRRVELPERGDEARLEDRRLHRLGRQGVVLRGARRQDQVLRGAGRLPRRPDLRERRQADQGPPERRRPERQDHHAGRLHAGLGDRPAGWHGSQRTRPCRSRASRTVRSRAPARRSCRRSPRPTSGRRIRTRCTQPRRPRCWSRRSHSPTAPRADIAKQLFKINLKGSILGDVSFNANGDVTANPVTIYKVNGASRRPSRSSCLRSRWSRSPKPGPHRSVTRGRARALPLFVWNDLCGDAAARRRARSRARARRLYALAAGEFTKARNDLSSRLKRAHQAEAAAASARSEKPTTVAWAANQLARVRARPDRVAARDVPPAPRHRSSRHSPATVQPEEVVTATAAERTAVRSLLASARRALGDRATPPCSTASGRRCRPPRSTRQAAVPPRPRPLDRGAERGRVRAPRSRRERQAAARTRSRAPPASASRPCAPLPVSSPQRLGRPRPRRAMPRQAAELLREEAAQRRVQADRAANELAEAEDGAPLAPLTARAERHSVTSCRASTCRDSNRSDSNDRASTSHASASSRGAHETSDARRSSHTGPGS